MTGGNCVFVFFTHREEFKFFGEMEKIFRKELKVDGSVADVSVTDEPRDSTLEPGQKKGETKKNHNSKVACINIYTGLKCLKFKI